MAKAKQLIDIYEHDSGLFDARGDIAPGREHYYYTKGAYELAANNTAEAEALFRKAIRYGYASDGYSGLLEIYRRKGNIDSVAHFSYQYEAAQDSLHHAMQIDAIHRYAALYNYSHSEKVAQDAIEQALRARSLAVMLLACLLCGILLSFYVFYQGKKKKRAAFQKLQDELSVVKMEKMNAVEELSSLKSKDYKGLAQKKEEKIRELNLHIEKLSHGISRQGGHGAADQLKRSKIVSVFHKKDASQGAIATPTVAEWDLLETQARQEIPGIFNFLCKDGLLSPLELHVCLLILMDFPDSSIVNLTNSSAQTVSKAKARANDKLFKEKGARTLRINLKQKLHSRR